MKTIGMIGGLSWHPRMCEEYACNPFSRRMAVLDYPVFYHVNAQCKPWIFTACCGVPGAFKSTCPPVKHNTHSL